MRLPLTLLVLVLACSAPAGCGDADEATTSGPAEGKASTAEIRSAWQASVDCERPAGASRWGCSVGSYRCQAVVVDRGWSVACAEPGRSVAFRVRPSR
jgi:hypothetical protein